MSTRALPVRSIRVADPTRSSLVAALGLHALVIGGVLAWGLISMRAHKPSWGETSAQAGSVQASMVSALPLAPRQPVVDKAVLASEKANVAPTPVLPAPVPPKAKAAALPPKAEAAPKPNEILLPKKTASAKAEVKPDAHETPTPPKRVPAPTPPTPKATTGDAPGIQLPQSVTQLRNGTASITVEDRTFGERYAYYVKIINRKVAENWNVGEADAHASTGKRAIVTFTIDRDGVPQNPHVETRSGSPTLDISALRAVERVEGFGPLPQATPITVQFAFDYKQP